MERTESEQAGASERRTYLCRRCGACSDLASDVLRRRCSLCGTFAEELALLEYPEEAQPRIRREEGSACREDEDPVTQVRRIPTA
jgi:hypothetical protein